MTWQTVFADAYSDLSNDLEHDLRIRIRAVVREAENALDRLDPVLLDWSDRRMAQKTKFGGELFIAASAADPWGTTYLEFFQHSRNTGP